jgi:phage gp46-like protein
MKKIIDIKMRKNDSGIYDFSFADGDFITVEGFDTAIQISILGERRASESEVMQPQKRRGWWGNEASEIVGFEIGSKLWLLSQARLIQDTINMSVDYGKQCLQWLVDDKYFDKIVVSGEIKNQDTGILNFNLVENNNIVEKMGYDIRRKTFIDGEI